MQGRIQKPALLVLILSMAATFASMFYWDGGNQLLALQGPVFRWHGWPVAYLGCSVDGAADCMLNFGKLAQNFLIWLLIFAGLFLLRAAFVKASSSQNN